ncbi:Protein SEC13 like protein [Chelonia mydas]|uniref:Protein SEC13 homolog n=1 Tax=Chelonia mydas TaxID=8469 RepID=M7BU02_CHEMY|nr:Protein SEC13 like protein [Chelonia mydas]
MVSVINTVDTSHEDMICSSGENSAPSYLCNPNDFNEVILKAPPSDSLSERVVEHDAQMDYYGTRLATCSSDRSVKIFDVRNGGQILIADLRGHEGPVWQVAWAHPMYGNILASCSYDRKVIVWKEENGTWEKTYEYTGHDSSVNSVCWAPHDYGLILACGSSDGAISLLSYTGDGQWEIKKISNAHTIGCNAVSWAPAVVPGSLIDQPSGQKPNYIKRFASGGCDNLIKIWKEEDGQWKEEQKLEAHSDWVRDVAWAPSIGLPTSTIASCSQQRKDPKKHTTKLNRRAAEGLLDADARQIEGDNEIEIKLNVPFEIGVKITEDQYQEYGQVLEKILEDILAEDTLGTSPSHIPTPLCGTGGWRRVFQELLLEVKGIV